MTDCVDLFYSLEPYQGVSKTHSIGPPMAGNLLARLNCQYRNSTINIRRKRK